MSEAFYRRRIVFKRGQHLYSALVGRDGISEAHPLLRMDSLVPNGDIWSVSPDERRIAWFGKYNAVRMTVYVASLPNMRYRHVLFSTDNLRDWRGHPVTRISLGEQTDDLEPWNLRWSRDGRSLYVSMKSSNTLSNFYTCAVDGQTGRAVTDEDGAWRLLLPTGNVDESEGYLVDWGQGRTTDESEVCNACSKYNPLYAAAKRRGSVRSPISLLPSRFTSHNKPPYGFAESCAIAPDGEHIVFGSNGLWLTSLRERRYVRLLAQEGGFSKIAWVGDRTLVYLYTHHEFDEGDAGSLWSLAMTPHGRVAGQPRCLLRGEVTRFEALAA